MFYGKEPKKKKGRLPIVCVHAVLVRCDRGDEPHIHLQERRVIDHEYDPLGDGKWETVGETLNPLEDFTHAVNRGIGEECGYDPVPDNPPWLISGQGERQQYHQRDRKEEALVLNTRVTMMTEGSQFWLSIAFIVEVSAGFKIRPDKEGETGEHVWVPVSELAKALGDPDQPFRGRYFMPLSVPALKYACGQLMDTTTRLI